MNPARRSSPDLRTLVSLFYAEPDELGGFEEVTSDQLPQPFRKLLAHNEHMTVTVESHHNCPVDVEVLQTHVTPSHYARKILLRRQSDRQTVQYGIVRLSFDYLSQEVRTAIESQSAPLGRILIEHDVLREVQLTSLWRIQAGDELCELLQLPIGSTTFGRTALIFCNSKPAVELLEIVTPA